MKPIKNIISQLTLEEKASLCSGFNFWYLKGMDRLGYRTLWSQMVRADCATRLDLLITLG